MGLVFGFFQDGKGASAADWLFVIITALASSIALAVAPRCIGVSRDPANDFFFPEDRVEMVRELDSFVPFYMFYPEAQFLSICFFFFHSPFSLS